MLYNPERRNKLVKMDRTYGTHLKGREMALMRLSELTVGDDN
jgi:hypothetical protein